MVRAGQYFNNTGYGLIDSLNYTYSDPLSNQLTNIFEQTPGIQKNKGFKPGPSSGYLYDENGNLISDTHKNMSIQYNYLNLPETINFAGGNQIVYLYDATGKKLQKKVSPDNTGTTTLNQNPIPSDTYQDNVIESAGNVPIGHEVFFKGTSRITLKNGFKGYGRFRGENTGTIVQDYCNGIEYHCSALEAIYHSEGRLYFNGGGERYEYTLADHLGNSRVTFADIDGNGFISASTEILQENHYYPFGLAQEGNWTVNTGNTNDYLYNGKELDTDFGLNWYHYGARMYDPTVGRWNGVDPLAEKYSFLTPYSYVANMPTIAIDPDGERIIFINGKIGGGSPPAGAPYWGGANSDFVRGAQNYFNDYDSPFFTTEDYGYLNDESSRVSQGRAYAKDNLKKLTKGLDKEKDVFRLVTHSMGGAFGLGLKEQLEAEGWKVENVLLLNTFEADELDYSGTPSQIIDYQNTDDPVIGLFNSTSNYGDVKGADIKIRINSGKEDFMFIHRFPIDNAKKFWSTLDNLIREYWKNQPHDDIPDKKDPNRGEK